MPLLTQREYRVSNNKGIQGITLHEVSVPKPRAHQVLVKVHAVTLQFRDLTISTGKYPLKIKESPVPGSDFGGEIVQVGEEVLGWKKGDRVCANFFVDLIAGDHTPETVDTSLGGPIDGVLTEYKVLPSHCLVRIPEHLSYEEASTLPGTGLAAYNALMGPVPAKGGDYVLVQGTGGVSIFSLQYAVALGAVVIATSSSDEKLQLAEKLGAKYLINYKKTPDWDKEVMKITNGRGVDHIIEVGGPGTISKSLNCIRYGGWVHQIGYLANEVEPGQPGVAMQCLAKAAILRGILVGSRHQFEAMNRFISATQFRPIIDKVFSFEHVRDAYEYMVKQANVGRIIIQVAGK